MESLIKRIFSECGFESVAASSTGAFFASKADGSPEYYLLEYVEINRLKSFAEGDDNTVMQLFEDQRKNDKEISKNTSLVLCVKAKNLESDYDAHKNSILLIEENQYFFKRYVIIYTEQAVVAFKDYTPVVPEMQKKILSTTSFQGYKENPFSSDDYFLLMQIFLKLPFLNVPEQSATDYKPLEELIGTKLSERQMQLREALNQNEDIHITENWEHIRSAAVDVNGDNKILEDLFKIITDHA